MIRDGFWGAIIGLMMGICLVLLGCSPQQEDPWQEVVWWVGLPVATLLIGGVVDLYSFRLYHHFRKRQRRF